MNISRRMNAAFIIAAVLFTDIIFIIISGYFGCNQSYGIGKYTDSDGRCSNYIYGYSQIGETIDVLIPLLLGFIIFIACKYKITTSFILSFVVYVSFFIVAMIVRSFIF